MRGVGAYFLEQSVKDILVIFLFAIGIEKKGFDNMKKIILFLGVFYVGLVSAQGIEADINAIIEKAKTGNENAQYTLGGYYFLGSNGVEQSYSKAAYWWEKAAEQGHGDAQFNIGVCYYNGDGVEQSKTKAIYWFRKACNNFEDKACEALNKIK